MKTLVNSIKDLKQTKVKALADARIKEFKALGKKQSKELFKELCFCILTANFNAERAIGIQSKIGNGFLALSKRQLAKKLRELSHRFPNTRAAYIYEAQRHKSSLKEILNSFPTEFEAREWLVENVKGISWKEASHFMRNIGYENVAIIDFHVIDFLVKHNLVQKPKNLSKSKYLEIESMLSKIAEKTNLTLAELDLYMWYMETEKVLK